jgi:hypothetical protein
LIFIPGRSLPRGHQEDLGSFLSRVLGPAAGKLLQGSADAVSRWIYESPNGRKPYHPTLTLIYLPQSTIITTLGQKHPDTAQICGKSIRLSATWFDSSETVDQIIVLEYGLTSVDIHSSQPDLSQTRLDRDQR